MNAVTIKAFHKLIIIEHFDLAAPATEIPLQSPSLNGNGV